MTITNGTIEFTRRLTTGDYQHKDAKVSLSFDNEDEAGIERISQMAVNRALTMVGEYGRSPAMVAVEAQKVENAERVKAVVTDEHQAKVETLNTPWKGPEAGQQVRAMADIMGAANPTATAASPVTATAEPEVPASVVITDKRLNDEVSAKNAALITAAGSDDTQRQLATQKVLRLVDEFTQLPPGPGRLSKVPAEKREAFLKALGALT